MKVPPYLLTAQPYACLFRLICCVLLLQVEHTQTHSTLYHAVNKRFPVLLPSPVEAPKELQAIPSKTNETAFRQQPHKHIEVFFTYRLTVPALYHHNSWFIDSGCLVLSFTLEIVILYFANTCTVLIFVVLSGVIRLYIRSTLYGSYGGLTFHLAQLCSVAPRWCQACYTSI